MCVAVNAVPSNPNSYVDDLKEMMNDIAAFRRKDDIIKDWVALRLYTPQTTARLYSLAQSVKQHRGIYDYLTKVDHCDWEFARNDWFYGAILPTVTHPPQTEQPWTK